MASLMLRLGGAGDVLFPEDRKCATGKPYRTVRLALIRKFAPVVAAPPVLSASQIDGSRAGNREKDAAFT